MTVMGVLKVKDRGGVCQIEFIRILDGHQDRRPAQEQSGALRDGESRLRGQVKRCVKLSFRYMEHLRLDEQKSPVLLQNSSQLPKKSRLVRNLVNHVKGHDEIDGIGDIYTVRPALNRRDA